MSKPILERLGNTAIACIQNGMLDAASLLMDAKTEIERLQDEVEYLNGQLGEQDKQAARAIEEAAYDAACEAERELQRGIRSREDGWG